MTLLTLVTAAALSMAPIDRAPAAEVDLALSGIAAAVESDELAPLTGSREGDAVLLTVWSHHESRWRTCASGDGGKSLGILQIQKLTRDVACSPADAARVWLKLAHAAVAKCGDLTPLASGRCGRARGLVVKRMGEAARLTIRVQARARPDRR